MPLRTGHSTPQGLNKYLCESRGAEERAETITGTTQWGVKVQKVCADVGLYDRRQMTSI